MSATEQTITLNHTVAECLRTVNDFGGTTITNICSGTSTFVPWGSLDWVGVVGLCVFAAVFLIGLGGALLRVAFDWY